MKISSIDHLSALPSSILLLNVISLYSIVMLILLYYTVILKESFLLVNYLRLGTFDVKLPEPYSKLVNIFHGSMNNKAFVS